tara:strand:- start:909 stop:1202 length:294 start_codon:yes stop_codon:yes gene_type:complete
LINSWNSLVNCGIIITIEILDISIIDINVIKNEAHLGIERTCLIFPVIVHKAIAIIVDANNKINISLKLHKINVEINKAANGSQDVCFNFKDYLCLR